MNMQDLSTAKDVERQVTITEKNWASVLSLLRRVSEQQLELMEAQKALLTAQDIESHLAWQENRIQDQMDTLSSEVKSFARQAGSLSEKFSSASDKLVSKTDAELAKITSNTSSDLTSLARTTETKVSSLIAEAKIGFRKLIVTVGIISASLAACSLLLSQLWR